MPNSYWYEDILFVNDGSVWATDDDGDTVWIGTEEVILPVVRGNAAGTLNDVPDEIAGKARLIIDEMRQVDEIKQGEKDVRQAGEQTRGHRVPRGRSGRAARSR